MSIVKSIKDKSTDIRKNWCTTGKQKAEQLQDLGMKAIRGGITSTDWRNYMNEFATNEAELLRLTGQDPAYMQKVWGPPSLAYIVANGICTQFSFANTVRDMDEEMLAGIDDFSSVAPSDDGKKEADSISDAKTALPDEREDI